MSALCKGSISIGTGCGECQRCRDALARGVRPLATAAERAAEQARLAEMGRNA